MNDGPELYPLDTVKVIPTSKPHGIYFALRYLYEGYNDVIDPWEETKRESDVDSLLKSAWESVPSGIQILSKIEKLNT